MHKNLAKIPRLQRDGVRHITGIARVAPELATSFWVLQSAVVLIKSCPRLRLKPLRLCCFELPHGVVSFWVALWKSFGSLPTIRLEMVMNAILEHPVLVLNRFWQPIHTCSVRRSVHLLCLGHAQVVQVEGEERFNSHDLSSWICYSQAGGNEEMIHGARIAIRVPKIVVLLVYDRLPRLEVKFTRRNVFLRDQFTCQYCTKVLPETQLNLDHVTPRDKGGRTTWDNIVTSCFRCNTRKGNKLPHEANMHPQSKPFAPRWRPLFGMHENGLADESWNHFLQLDRKDTRRSA